VYDWYETMDDKLYSDSKWVIRTAESSEELVKLSEDLENDGWTIRTISMDNLSVLASKRKERLDD